MSEADRLTHVDRQGKARMVDVSTKTAVRRSATARGFIALAPRTVQLVRENGISKGDVVSVAKIAGIMGAKQTAVLIPLCHQVEIEFVDVQLTLQQDGVAIEAVARCTDKTGIEMEALTAVSVAALTVYDMCKAVDHQMRIGPIELVEKTKERPD
ncbi:MAG: cyclic pyranopterin monophosphate synthase MoaC [Spirochaetaceae bacterium]|nr:MAG: cyclic pyranopterin monophosphate synthase MoaC [Spirochaetaceae bacterium]